MYGAATASTGPQTDGLVKVEFNRHLPMPITGRVTSGQVVIEGENNEIILRLVI